MPHQKTGNETSTAVRGGGEDQEAFYALDFERKELFIQNAAGGGQENSEENGDPVTSWNC